ncbi:MAG: PocR ligand-binding domain-containing protein [Clostridia bacterium]|jgi:AraC-like DNA-binding protein/ligand-binding sensor protein
MEIGKNIEEIGFDLEKAIKCAEYYSRSTEIRTIIIDACGQILFEYDADKQNVCELCDMIHCNKKKGKLCSSTHLLYGGYQAVRFGGKYIFFCPLGLIHITSPITENGVMKASILCGPLLMMEPEDFLLDDIIKKNKIDEKYFKELKRQLSEVPIVNPEKVNCMSELLLIVAEHISDIKPSAFNEEREMLEQQSNISEYIHYIKTMGGSEADQEYPIEKERKLLSLISIGDKSGAKKILDEIFGHIFFSNSGDFFVVKSRILELVVLLSRAALEGGADIEQIFGLNYNYLSEINEFKTIEELTFWLSKTMTRFTDCVFNLQDVKHIDVIYKAIDYIRRNYMKKITLDEVAAFVFLSPSYFSKVFKDEMRTTFNNYLNHIRIEMSKKLLLDEKIALTEVSNLVGYEAQSYFSKVFKKVSGVSPGKYRESRGQHIGS